MAFYRVNFHVFYRPARKKDRPTPPCTRPARALHGPCAGPALRGTVLPACLACGGIGTSKHTAPSPPWGACVASFFLARANACGHLRHAAGARLPPPPPPPPPLGHPEAPGEAKNTRSLAGTMNSPHDFYGGRKTSLNNPAPSPSGKGLYSPRSMCVVSRCSVFKAKSLVFLDRGFRGTAKQAPRGDSSVTRTR